MGYRQEGNVAGCKVGLGLVVRTERQVGSASEGRVCLGQRRSGERVRRDDRQIEAGMRQQQARAFDAREPGGTYHGCLIGHKSLNSSTLFQMK